MHALMDDSKLRIIQSYEQGLAPAGSDKRGPAVPCCNHRRRQNNDKDYDIGSSQSSNSVVQFQRAQCCHKIASE